MQFFNLVHILLDILDVATYIFNLCEELLHERGRLHVDPHVIFFILVLRLFSGTIFKLFKITPKPINLVIYRLKSC